MYIDKIARMIDLSCVQANSSIKEIKEVADFAIKYNCICTFALPAHTPLLVDLLKDYPEILVGGVVGFPDGGATTKGKLAEALELIEMGVNELDMVMNIAWLKNEQAAALGAAALAAVGTGIWKDFSIVDEIHKTESIELPQKDENAFYEKLLPVYKTFSNHLSEIGDVLIQI